MNLLAFIQVFPHGGFELASRDIGGEPWIVRMAEQLAMAETVGDVVVGAYGAFGGTGFERPLYRSDLDIRLGDIEDPWSPVLKAAEGFDAVSLCQVPQLFVDPARLDELARAAEEADADISCPVFRWSQDLPLRGGAFLDILSRRGLETSSAFPDKNPFSHVDKLKLLTWPTDPGPLLTRLEDPDEYDWATAVYEAMLVEGVQGRFDDFEDILAKHDLFRFPFWDRIGPPPKTLLTIRCLHGPLFKRLLDYWRRVPGLQIDVIAREGLRGDTKSMEGVRRVITYPGERFSLSHLGFEVVEYFREEQYDLCVIPYLVSDENRYENVLPLAAVSGAKCGIWMDTMGNSGVLTGLPQAWDPTWGQTETRIWQERE